MTEAELAAGASVIIKPDSAEAQRELRERETYLLLTLTKIHFRAMKAGDDKQTAAVHQLINASLNRLFTYNLGTK